MSPLTECATAFHNGGHYLFGGESVGILFQASLEVECLTQQFLQLDAGFFSVSFPPASLLASVFPALCAIIEMLKLTVYSHLWSKTNHILDPLHCRTH